MYPVLDRMTALVSLYREDPEVRAALPAASPLGGGPLEPVLFGLLDLGIALERRPEDRARTAALGVGVTLHLAALAAGRPGRLPSYTDVARLAGFQAERLGRHRGPDAWRAQPPRNHLGSAFRQLLTLAAHLGAPEGGRPLIDLLLTAADLANYVAFTLDAAGVFDAPAGAREREVPCRG